MSDSFWVYHRELLGTSCSDCVRSCGRLLWRRHSPHFSSTSLTYAYRSRGLGGIFHDWNEWKINYSSGTGTGAHSTYEMRRRALCTGLQSETSLRMRVRQNGDCVTDVVSSYLIFHQTFCSTQPLEYHPLMCAAHFTSFACSPKWRITINVRSADERYLPIVLRWNFAKFHSRFAHSYCRFWVCSRHTMINTYRLRLLLAITYRHNCRSRFHNMYRCTCTISTTYTYTRWKHEINIIYFDADTLETVTLVCTYVGLHVTGIRRAHYGLGASGWNTLEYIHTYIRRLHIIMYMGCRHNLQVQIQIFSTAENKMKIAAPLNGPGFGSSRNGDASGIIVRCTHLKYYSIE